VPINWPQAFAAVAAAFHWQPSELYAMEVWELRMWLDEAAKIGKRDG
jgi:hypothetical protein